MLDYKKIPLDGVIDSPIDLRDYNYKDLCSNSNEILPREFELQYPFKPRNQKQTSTCAFQSVCGVMEILKDVSEYLSDGFLNAMRDEYNCYLSKGAITREIMSLACECGTVFQSDFHNLEDYPMINDSFNSLNNKNELINKAKKFKCQSYVRVDIEDIPDYIFNEKKPLVITTKLYDSFYKVNHPGTDGKVPYPSTGEKRGNHAMIIIGYRFEDDGTLWLKILNSWGEYWCLNGYCFINSNDDKLINEVWGFTDMPKKTNTTKYKIGWDKLNDKWVYSDDGKNLFQNGWKLIKNEWYYFKNTYALDGEWIYDGYWYYLNNSSCQMVKGIWCKIKGEWYMFDNDGKMLTGWYKDNIGLWFYLNNNGKMCVGWLLENNKQYYLEERQGYNRGHMYCNGDYNINGKFYHFNQDGVMDKKY